ncbi:DUF2778 domain-containing protein [Methylobacterium sp. J-076]|uniref:DUF2778 domain-containing protein n=1 Tax=Methylobacterium sp. J-076 TaxID=2836655 RepID=UPI001FBB4F13|nr:DUF2778 domain-containing protein [Methylobacterium sp. J-076]MCJ2014370.1 DUF2778 domain-containing protein [Methylobacterium sp. J-076]
MSSIAYARRPRQRRSPLPALACLTALAAAGWTVLNRPHGEGLRATPPVLEAGARLRGPLPDVAWVFDPAPVLGSAAAGGFLRDLPVLALNAALPPAAPVAVLAEAAPAVPATSAALAPPRRVAAAEPTLVPLPVPRPAGLAAPARAVPPGAVAAAAPAPAPAPVRVATRRAGPATRDVFRAAIAEEPSFLERLFGGGSAPAGAGQALAYAGPDAIATPRGRLVPAPSSDTSAGVAVYDISASTVTLPSGEVLEAHSGYGDLMDDPRYVHVRMRGATPPGTYEMTERGALFHGVRAIRLTPQGGSGAIHGRDGILAHTYMLRAQPGASNGCVVFRDYDRFLRAFLRGEVRRMVVVAGNRSARIDLARR